MQPGNLEGVLQSAPSGLGEALGGAGFPAQPFELKPESISPSKAPPAPSDVEKKKQPAAGADSAPKKEDGERREQKQPEKAFFVGSIEVGDGNKYSVAPKEQAKRLEAWLSNMRLFKLFNNDRLP